jgi:hypothetical protein
MKLFLKLLIIVIMVKNHWLNAIKTGPPLK